MILDKLKYGAINNKKILLSLGIFFVIAIVMGTLFLTILSKSDQNIVINYMNDYMSNISNNKIIYSETIRNSLISNLGYVILIWLLGISVIGLPIILFMFFSKIFVLGFSVGSFILTYHWKGLLYSFIYIFPMNIINILIYMLLTLYALKMSNNLVYSVFRKKEINVKKIINRYLLILLISVIAMILYSFYEVFIIPLFLNALKSLIH